MPDSTDKRIRTQIEAVAAERFSTLPIEERIAASLTTFGMFDAVLTPEEFELILRGIIYTSFDQQTFAGVNVGLVHNIVSLSVEHNELEMDIECIVHIHKPIISFIEFSYTLENEPDQPGGRIQVRDGSLLFEAKTRRLDVKAKTALAAMNVRKIMMQEMSDLTAIIFSTLPPQLRALGVDGKLDDVGLEIVDSGLRVRLYGTFVHLVTP